MPDLRGHDVQNAGIQRAVPQPWHSVYPALLHPASEPPPGVGIPPFTSPARWIFYDHAHGEVPGPTVPQRGSMCVVGVYWIENHNPQQRNKRLMLRRLRRMMQYTSFEAWMRRPRHRAHRGPFLQPERKGICTTRAKTRAVWAIWSMRGRVITLITWSYTRAPQGHVQSRLEYHDAKRNGQKSKILWAFGNINWASFRMSSHRWKWFIFQIHFIWQCVPNGLLV